MTFHVEGFTVRLFLATPRYITLFLLFIFIIYVIVLMSVSWY